MFFMLTFHGRRHLGLSKLCISQSAPLIFKIGCCRYLVCEIKNDDKRKMQFSTKEFLNCLKNAVTKYHGDYGMGCVMTSIGVKHLNLDTGITIVRSKRGCHLMVQSSMTFITKIKDYNVMINTLHIGGTMKACQKFLIKYHQKQLASSLKHCKTKEEKQQVYKAIKRSDAKIKRGKPKIQLDTVQIVDPMKEDVT